MLRTNPSFLSFIEDIYQQNQHGGDVVLKSFSRGRFLLEQGSRPTKVFIIKEGIAKVFFSEENGKDFIFEFLSAGEIVGELEAIRDTDCLCNIGAVSDVLAYALDSRYFRALMNRDIAFNRLLLNELAERLANTSTRSSFQQLYTIGHGLKKILELQKKQQITLSKEDMAAYMGVTLRSLNRALKELEQAKE